MQAVADQYAYVTAPTQQPVREESRGTHLAGRDHQEPPRVRRPKREHVIKTKNINKTQCERKRHLRLHQASLILVVRPPNNGTEQLTNMFGYAPYAHGGKEVCPFGLCPMVREHVGAVLFPRDLDNGHRTSRNLILRPQLLDREVRHLPRSDTLNDTSGSTGVGSEY